MYHIMLLEAAFDGRPRYVRFRPAPDGDWRTARERNRKQWKTVVGARRWLNARPEIRAVIIKEDV
jgi:hypothetical protein